MDQTSKTNNTQPDPKNNHSSPLSTTTDGKSTQNNQTDQTADNGKNLQSNLNRVAWVSGASGVISGFLATILLHPLEVLKIRLQGDASGKSAYRFTLKEVIKVSRKVGLYTGMSANLIASMVAWGVFFGTNDYLRAHGRDYQTQRHNQRWERENNQTHLKPSPNTSSLHTNPTQSAPPAPNFIAMDFATSMLASTIAQIGSQPLWLMKTRMSLDQIPLSEAAKDPEAALRHAMSRKSSPYSSLYRALKYTAETEGLRGLYRGFSASMFGTTHGAIMMCSYSALKESTIVNRLLQDQPQWLQNVILPSYAAFLSKVIATLATYPTQVLRTSIQDHRVMETVPAAVVGADKSASMAGNIKPITLQQPALKPPTPLVPPPSYTLGRATKDIWNASGIKGFYRGVSMQIVRASFQNVIVFAVYESSKSFLGAPVAQGAVAQGPKKH